MFFLYTIIFEMHGQQNIKYDAKPFVHAPEVRCYLDVKSACVYLNIVRKFIYQ